MMNIRAQVTLRYQLLYQVSRSAVSLPFAGSVVLGMALDTIASSSW